MLWILFLCVMIFLSALGLADVTAFLMRLAGKKPKTICTVTFIKAGDDVESAARSARLSCGEERRNVIFLVTENADPRLCRICKERYGTECIDLDRQNTEALSSAIGKAVRAELSRI